MRLRQTGADDESDAGAGEGWFRACPHSPLASAGRSAAPAIERGSAAEPAQMFVQNGHRYSWPCLAR